MAKAREAPLRFRGVPQRVEGFVPIPHDELLTVAREATLDGVSTHDEHVAVQSIPHGRHTEIRLVLPEMTRPGDYRGTLRLGEHTFKIEAHVDPDAHLAAIPGRLDLASGAGEMRETVTLVNEGNAVATIARQYGFGLFSETGLDRTIGRAFASDAADGHARVETFMAAAADEYGGVVSATVAEGAGPLEPGQMRDVTFAFRLTQQKTRRGGAYFGYLSVANLTIPVHIRIANAKPTEVPS